MLRAASQMSRRRYFLLICAGALAYGIIGWVSLRMALTLANCSAVWILSGLCIGSLARFGDRYWPAIFVGPLVLNTIIALLNGVPFVPSVLSGIGVALAEVGEALLGAHFARRFFGTPPTLASPSGVFTLLFWVAFLPAIVSMSGGVISLWSTGILATKDIPSIVVMWTLGNVVGTTTCAPLFFVRSWRGWIRERLRFRVWESLALVAIVLIMVQAISGAHFSGWMERWPKSWLAVPLVLWISTRLGRRTTMVAVLFIMVTGVAQTMRGFPVFPADAPEQSLLGLQLFILMVAVLGLTVATLAHQLAVERRAMESVLASQILLETTMNEKAVMDATAVHDLQSPLHGIRNLLEFARATPERLSGPDRETLLADMQASVDRMLSLVNTTLAPLKENRNRAAIDPVELFDVSAPVRRAIEAETSHAGSKGITLFRRIPAQPVVIQAQPAAVEHVVANYLSNAVKFSPLEARIFVAVEEFTETVCISVADEGPGIAEEERADIFSGKIRPNGAKPTSGEPSNGLGLYLVGQLAERMNAQVTCEAGETGGSIFSLILKRQPEVDSVPRRETAQPLSRLEV